MFFFGGRRLRWLMGGGPTEELLDRPLSNYDVLGVPTGAWSSGLFACFNNVVPSCVLSFLCPCVMWSQVVVRAQIPLLISLKNTLQFMRATSGFGAFIEFFCWAATISAGLLIIIIMLHSQMPSMVTILLVIILIAVCGTLLSLLIHTRTAFRDKYELPSVIPLEGASFWDKVGDGVVTLMCFPCSLAQMARHVFQYERMDTDIGLYLSDPSALPPLRPTPEQEAAARNSPNGAFERPARADEAGLGRRQQNRENTGAAHRQEAIERRQREELVRDSAAPATAEYASSATSTPPMAPARVVR